MAQNPPSWFNWIPTAIVGILSAAAGALIAELIRAYRSRTRPQYLICEEEVKTSVVDERHVALPEALEASYQGTKLRNLWLLKLKFYNNGSNLIEDAKITVTLDEDVALLGPPTIEPRPSEGIVHFESPKVPDEKNKQTFVIDYLKSFKAYQQFVTLTFLSDGEITSVDVAGDGPNWTLKYLTPEEKGKAPATRARILLWILAFIIPTISAASFLLVNWVYGGFPISTSDLLILLILVVIISAGSMPLLPLLKQIPPPFPEG